MSLSFASHICIFFFSPCCIRSIQTSALIKSSILADKTSWPICSDVIDPFRVCVCVCVEMPKINPRLLKEMQNKYNDWISWKWTAQQYQQQYQQQRTLTCSRSLPPALLSPTGGPPREFIRHSICGKKKQKKKIISANIAKF
jgi:hypothetical protein